MKKLVCFIAMTALFLSQGCSAFRSTTQTVNISCSEPGTMLTVNGQARECPLQIEAKRNRDLGLQAYKEGYAPYMRTVGHHFSEIGALDAVGTALLLLPGIGLFSAGAWDLDETDISIQLLPTTAALKTSQAGTLAR